jgi:GAF domain-containing protein
MMNAPASYKKKFEILQEMSSAIALSDDIASIAGLLVDLALSFAGAEKGSLLLLNEKNEFEILASRGFKPPYTNRSAAGIEEGIAGFVMKTRTPLLVADINRDDRFKDLRRSNHPGSSFISCPIISRNNVLGILNINTKKDGASFTGDELDLMQILANQAAVAFQNAALLAQLRARAEEVESINRKLAAADLLKTEFFARMSHNLRTPLNSVKGAIYLLQRSGLSAQERAEFQDMMGEEVDNIIALVENTLKTLRVDDETRIVRKTAIDLDRVFRELRNERQLNALLSRNGIRFSVEEKESRIEILADRVKFSQLLSNLIDGILPHLYRGDAVRLRAEENGIVSIHLEVSSPLPEDVTATLRGINHLFPDHDPESLLKLHLAKSVADAHRWRIVAHNDDAAGRITLHIPTSAEETVEAYVGMSMDAFVDFTAALMRVDICSLMLSNGEEEFAIRSAIGLEDRVVRKTRLKPGDRIAGWVAREGKPLFIRNIEDDQRFRKKNVTPYSTKSLISLPLINAGRAIGVLNMNNKKDGSQFTDEDFELASRVGGMISRFLEIIYAKKFDEDAMKRYFASLHAELLKSGGEAHLPKLRERIREQSDSVRKVKLRQPS